MFWSDTSTGAGAGASADVGAGGTAEEHAEVAGGPEPAPPGQAVGEVTDQVREEADRVAADEEFLAAMAAEFDAIEASLVRLDDGTFDICEVCGARIGQDRLIADPLITRCPAHS